VHRFAYETVHELIVRSAYDKPRYRWCAVTTVQRSFVRHVTSCDIAMEVNLVQSRTVKAEPLCTYKAIHIY